MFFFLSKNLPVLFQPPSLVCWFLLVALVLIWRRSPREVTGAILLLALTCLWLAGNNALADRLVGSLEKQYRDVPRLEKADAIVVLGGCTEITKYPRVWPEVNGAGDRIFQAARIYKAGWAPVIITSGGQTALTLNPGLPTESQAMAALLMEVGVPQEAIIEESQALNTYQNVTNVHKILNQRGWQRVLVVTSAIHMPRAMAIFAKQGIAAIPVPTDFLVTVSPKPSQLPANLASRLIRNIRVITNVPRAWAIVKLNHALKEYMGMEAYRLRGWL